MHSPHHNSPASLLGVLFPYHKPWRSASMLFMGLALLLQFKTFGPASNYLDQSEQNDDMVTHPLPKNNHSHDFLLDNNNNNVQHLPPLLNQHYFTQQHLMEYPGLKDRLQHTHPLDLGGCLSVRFKELPLRTFTLEEAEVYMKQQQQQSPKQWKFGITFTEDSVEFWSLLWSNFHLFHFLEFLTYSYMGLHRLAMASSANATLLQRSSLQDPSSSSILSVQWIHAPTFFRQELHGSRHINQLISHLVYGTHVQLYGLEDNDDLTRWLHLHFQGKTGQKWYQLHPWRTKTSTPQQLDEIRNATLRQFNFDRRTATADATLYVFRQHCPSYQSGQMIAALSDDGVFPAQQWHDDIVAGLRLQWQQQQTRAGEATKQSATTTTTTTQFDQESLAQLQKLIRSSLPQSASPEHLFRVCYIDRQNSYRTMPQDEHEWLLYTLQNYPGVEFWHLHMQDYTGLQQVQIAFHCHMIVGLHGNGLSHQMWMAPGSYVVEIYWKHGFVFCFSIMARMMNHHYLGLWRGQQLNATRILAKDGNYVKREVQRNQRMTPEQGRQSFLDFLQQALNEHQQKQKRN